MDLLRRMNYLLKHTERHVKSQSYMKIWCSDTEHQFDIWHVSKSIKKLKEVSKKCDCAGSESVKAVGQNKHFWQCCTNYKRNPIFLKE